MMAHQHALPADDEETMRREGNVLGRILSPCSTGGPVPARGVPYWSEFVVFHRECREPIAVCVGCHFGRLERFGDTAGDTRAS